MISSEQFRRESEALQATEAEEVQRRQAMQRKRERRKWRVEGGPKTFPSEVCPFTAPRAQQRTLPSRGRIS